MDDWKSVLKADPSGWLLEDDNPSVKYFTLIDILGEPESSPQVKQARSDIMAIGTVPKILDRQNHEGYWGVAEDFYVRSKYTGTVWQLIILAALGADRTHAGIKQACEFILNHSQDRGSGGFSMRGTAKNGGNHGAVIPCLTGNMVWSLIRFEYLNDARLQKGIDWITTYQRFDDMDTLPGKSWPYAKAEPCWGRHTCSMGAIKTLKAPAEIPVKARSPETTAMIDEGSEYFLRHHIYKRSHDLDQVCKPSWLKFGFPLMYQTDALEILGILAGLGYRDDRMQEALDLVISKQDDRGRWTLESTFNGKFLTNIERKGQTSKWITLNALRAVKAMWS